MNWSQASSVGTCTAMSSRKVIACEIAPLSLLLNTPFGRSSQQSLVQEAVSSMLVSSQNALTNGETFTSRAFPFGHCHHRLHMASLTLCKAQDYTSNHSELSTSSCTSSHIMNCKMFRTVRADGQMSHPCTLALHHQMASERTMPSVPIISGATNSYQGTSSSKMPWTTNCNQRVVCQVGSTVSSISSSLLMSMWYPVCCLGLPLEHSSLPSAEDQWPVSSRHITWWTGICWVWKSSSNASSWSCKARAIPSLEWLDQVWGGMLTAESTLGVVLMSWDAAVPQ